MKFIINRRNKFKAWWKRPSTKVDRFFAAIIGAVGMFWVALLSPAVLPINGPFTLNQIACWFAGFILTGIIIGIIFPKIVSVVLYPFALCGIGPS